MDKNFFKKTFFLGLVVFVFSFAQHAIASSCPFTRELSSGVTHQEVAELQRFLSNDSTIYPEKLVTGYYGNLTVNAVKRFQGGAGLLQSGKVDMATMNALCMIFEQFVLQTGGYSEPAKVATTTAKAITQAPQDFSSSGSSCPFDRELSLGNKNNAVTELQKFLSNDESIYPEKMVTGYYGNLTVNAIKRFQAKAGLLQSGKVDMATSTVLCQMFLSYKLSEPVKIDVSFSSDGCVVKTVNLGPGYFEAANSEVASLQKYLNQNGFYPENIVSGFYGNLTAAAVKRLQSHYGIKATGVIDKDTMTVICGSASSAYSDSSGSIDLAISNIEADPAQIDVNVPVKISVSHKNIGNINSGNHRTSLLINEQEVAFMQSNGLKPNEEINSINHTWTCKEKGIYIFKIFVDSKNDNIEKNKYNNVIVFPVNCGGVTQDLKYACSSETQSCSVSPMGTMTLEECNNMCGGENKDLPDLTVSSFSPSKMKVGETAELVIMEKNIGKATAGAHSYEIEFKYQGDSKKIDGVLGALAANQEQKISGPFTCSSPGVYRITVDLDTKNEVKESNESNNKKEFILECADASGRVPEDPKSDTPGKDSNTDNRDRNNNSDGDSAGASGRPDLTIWFSSVNNKTPLTKLDQGKTFVHIYIKNGTAVPVNSGFKISLKSEDCNKVEDVPGTPIPWPKIGANQEINMAGEKGWEITCDYANPWKITAFIDSENSILELYENNNVAVISCGELKCSSDTRNPKDEPSKDGCNNDWCNLCNPTTFQCEFLSKAEYTKEKYSSWKRFESSLACYGKDSPCWQKAECNPDSKFCRLVDKSTPTTGDSVGALRQVFDTYEECSDKCGGRDYPHTRYRCSAGKCVATTEAGVGTYSSQAACLSNCITYTPSPSTTAPVVASRYKCVSGRCVVTSETGSGTYASKSQCDAACYSFTPLPSSPVSPPVKATRYKCVSNKCVTTTETGTGTYTSETDCKKVCEVASVAPAPPSFWDLFTNNW